MTEGAHERLLDVLQRLMAIEALEVRSALAAASNLVNSAFGADKTDAFFVEPETQTLQALGTSDTLMGRLQHTLGLDRLPIANGGRTVECFLTGQPYFTAHADQDPVVIKGVREALGVRTMVAAAIDVAGERRGVLLLCSATPAFWSEEVVDFVRTVAGWVGLVAHRAELVERVTASAAEQARQLVAEELVTVLAHAGARPCAVAATQRAPRRARE
jgi:two-component system OmpR family sensor kinase